MKPLKIIFIYFILAMSVLLVFWQVRDFDFVNYDDQDYVYENRHVLDGLSWDGVIWAFTSGDAANWHPVTWLSLMLDCQMFGNGPGRIHLVNVFWHLVNTLLLLAVLKKMTGALWPSVFVAAAFGLHPMHVESVAWIAERKDVLSTFFLLLTLVAYAGYVKRPSAFGYLLSLVLFALGLMSKPMLVTLPFAMLLLDYWPLNRFEASQPAKKTGRQIRKSEPAIDKHSNFYRLIIEKVPFVVLSAASSTITFIVQRSSGAMGGSDVISLESRLANAVLSYARYIGKMLWPENLAVLYPFDVSGGIAFWQVTLCVLLLAGVTLLVLCLGRRQKYLPVGWFWFVGTLVPVIGLVQVGSQAYADRYTYIPYIGLFIMIGWGLPALVSKWPYRRVVLGVSMVIVLMVLGVCSYRQVSYWNNGYTLFSHAVEVTEDNGLAYNNLGVEYGKLGRYPDAIEAFKQAISVKPDYADAYNNLGVAYNNLGRYQDAIEALNQAIKIKPEFAETYYNFGIAYHGLGRYPDAIEAFNRAISIKPNDAKAYYNLGIIYGCSGRHVEAIEAFKQAISVKPDYAEVYNNLGVAYFSCGRYEEAIEAYKQTIRLRPEYADAHLSLGMAYLKINDKTSAMEEYKILKTLNKEMAERLLNGIGK